MRRQKTLFCVMFVSVSLWMWVCECAAKMKDILHLPGLHKQTTTVFADVVTLWVFMTCCPCSSHFTSKRMVLKNIEPQPSWPLTHTTSSRKFVQQFGRHDVQETFSIKLLFIFFIFIFKKTTSCAQEIHMRMRHNTQHRTNNVVELFSRLKLVLKVEDLDVKINKP